MNIVFDLDGTLCDISHRLHHIQKEPKDWDAFFSEMVNDKSIEEMTGIVWDLSRENTIIICTGRPDNYKDITIQWLFSNSASYSEIYMRKEGDHRSDVIVKKELLDQMIKDGFKPDIVFEDRSRVVDMWRENGIMCLQVCEGNY